MRYGCLGLLLAGCKRSSLPPSYFGPPEDDNSLQPEDLGDEECLLADPVVLCLSPDDSNSMSSPIQAREAVSGWADLSAVAIRPWEFLNYYTFDYPRAAPGELSVELELAPGEVPGQYRVQIGIASEPELVSRPPIDLALVIDTSGSMEGEPLEMAKQVGEAIASRLIEGDRVSVVIWASDQNILLEDHEVSGPDDAEVFDALASLRSEGSTDLSSGLQAGYALLERHQDPSRISRLVLISDGGANLGVTDAELIGAAAGEQDEDGIYLVGVGVGTTQTYNDELVDQVTDLGQGASIFIQDQNEARHMFTERFASTLTVAARDVQVRLDLPPGFSLVSTSAEEVSTDPEQVRPQHVAMDDAAVLHQVVESCTGAEVPSETPLGVTVTWSDISTFESRETSLQTTFGELLAADPRLLHKGAAILAYAEALRAFRDEGAGVSQEALDALQLAETSNPGDADLAEIHGVLDAL
jgi:Ca-activated chloride channel family protein